MQAIGKSAALDFRYNIELVYTDEPPNMTGLPEWDPPDPEENDSYMAWLISLGLLFFTLVLPTAIVLIASRFKRSLKHHIATKPLPEELSLLDHIFDPDGHYRETIFEGMLSEDAADEVEIPAKSKKDSGLSGDTTKVEKMSATPVMKNASTQTDGLFSYSGAKSENDQKGNAIFDSPLKRTMDESDNLTPIEEFLLKGTKDQLKHRTTRVRKLSLKPTQRETQRQRKKRSNETKGEHAEKKDDANRAKETATKYQIARTQEVASIERTPVKKTPVVRTPAQNAKGTASQEERKNLLDAGEKKNTKEG